MQTRPTPVPSLRLAALLLAVTSASTAQDSRGGPDPSSPRGDLGAGQVVLYQATGVRDGANIATVVHCTNVGTEPVSGAFQTRELSGGIDCTTQSISVSPNRTVTFATRSTAFYFEDRTCATAPFLEQGSVYVLISEGGAGRLICTAQVLDAANAVPSFITTLDVFRR